VKKISLIGFLFVSFLAFPHTHSLQLVRSGGDTLLERISLPYGFERVSAEENSFAEYLRNYPLKKAGSPVLLFNGNEKQNQVAHAAVFNLKIESEMQKSVQSVIHLYSDFYLKNHLEDKIAFHLTNGEVCSWNEWLEKSNFKRKTRQEVSGNLKKWTKYEASELSSDSKSEIYKSYLKNVFANTSPLSVMEYESSQVKMEEVQIGDILFDLGQPEHICLVVDMIKNKKTGEKAFLLAQGSNPAQEFHIIKNPKRENDPWYYEEDFISLLKTPEYAFPKDSFRHLKY